MPEFIEQEVADLRESSSHEETTVLVGCEGDRDELGQSIREISGQVEGQIGRTTLRVSIPKSGIDDLCEIDSVVSVELDADDVMPQSQRNFRHQTGSMM